MRILIYQPSVEAVDLIIFVITTTFCRSRYYFYVIIYCVSDHLYITAILTGPWMVVINWFHCIYIRFSTHLCYNSIQLIYLNDISPIDLVYYVGWIRTDYARGKDVVCSLLLTRRRIPETSIFSLLLRFYCYDVWLSVSFRGKYNEYSRYILVYCVSRINYLTI